MIQLAAARLEPSTVVNVKDGSSIPSTVRTSYGSFLNAAPSETVDRVNHRLADLTMLPPENGEAIQVSTNQCSPRRCAHGPKGIVMHRFLVYTADRLVSQCLLHARCNGHFATCRTKWCALGCVLGPFAGAAIRAGPVLSTAPRLLRRRDQQAAWRATRVVRRPSVLFSPLVRSRDTCIQRGRGTMLA